MFVIKGIVEKIAAPEKVGEKQWPKQTVVIRTYGERPQTLEFEAFGKTVATLPPIYVGKELEVTFDVQGNYGKDGQRVFVKLSIISAKVTN